MFKHKFQWKIKYFSEYLRGCQFSEKRTCVDLTVNCMQRIKHEGKLNGIIKTNKVVICFPVNKFWVIPRLYIIILPQYYNLM